MGNLCGGPDQAPESNIQTRLKLKLQKAPRKVGHYTWKGAPEGYREACLSTLRRAEADLGRPPYFIETKRYWNPEVKMISNQHLFAGL